MNVKFLRLKLTLISMMVMLNTFSYSAPEDEARKTLDQVDKSIELERERLERERQQKELENSKFNNVTPNDVPSVNDNGIKFLINKINLLDEDKLLSRGEKKKILKKYEGKELSANDITLILTDTTNLLIKKGYITSVATLWMGYTLVDTKDKEIVLY